MEISTFEPDLVYISIGYLEGHIRGNFAIILFNVHHQYAHAQMCLFHLMRITCVSLAACKWQLSVSYC